jgi:predicted phosphodiesterase
LDRIALISDIHGNIPALEAVLGNIRQRGIKRIFCLGDLVGKGPYPEKAIDICREVSEMIIRGNWDEVIGRGVEHPMFTWQIKRLDKTRLDYLKELPNTIDFLFSGRKIRLYHASQQGVMYRVQRNDAESKQLEMFDNTDFTGNTFEPDIIGYADIHIIFLKQFQDKILFNTGSVGNPLDYPQASYVVLEGNFGAGAAGAFSINIMRVPYDIELAIQQAEAEGIPDVERYADELRTGVYSGDKSLHQ